MSEMQHIRQPGTTVRRALSDTIPIEFPDPMSQTRPDSNAVEFEPSSDLLIDPYGNIYCFVCQVSVPKGAANISQHLEGKRHEGHNRRFQSDEQKNSIRVRYQNAARQQREALPPAPASTPASATNPTSAPKTSDPGSLSVVPSKKEKRAIKIALLQRHQSFSIDKRAFLNSVLSGNDEKENIPLAAADVTDDVDMDLDDNVDQNVSLEHRQCPFAPLAFKPPEGPDFLFDSMAPETLPTETAANIRKALSSAHAVKMKTPVIELDSADDAAEDNEIELVSSQLSGTKAHELGSYIQFNDPDVPGTATDTEKQIDAARLALESIDILKDTNGEELPPWLLECEATDNVLLTSDSSIALHFEILQFASFVSPTQAELESRKEMVIMVESIVKKLWPTSTPHIFGSYATGLYLPTSDIDICILGTPDGGTPQEQNQLAQAIRNVKGFARRVTVLSKTKVPLVKIISRKTSVNCDICIGQDNGPKNVPTIKKFLKEYPAARPLLLVVKCFLQQRDLNEVYSGGLGSYTIFLLVISHLQMLKYNFPECKANLGSVLQSFFQFYGRMFNLCIAGIRIKDSGSYFDKFEKYETLPHETLRFSVEDPNDETNELGKSGFAATRIRKVFTNASLTLIHWRRDDASAAPTPLASMIQFEDFLQGRRMDVIIDMEKKGLKPLRKTVDENKVRRGKTDQRLGTRSSERGKEGEKQTRIRGSSNEVGMERSFSGSRRERDSQDSQERESRERNPRDRDPRDRDPRLVKRRRGNASGQDERKKSNGSYNGGGDANNAGTSSQGSTGHGASQQNRGYSNGGERNNYDSGAVYGGQANYNEYPVPQYPVSTPGYQYVDQQAQAPYGSNRGVGQPMYPPSGGYYAGGGRPHNSYGRGRGRGGKKRSGTYGNRGSYRR